MERLLLLAAAWATCLTPSLAGPVPDSTGTRQLKNGPLRRTSAPKLTGKFLHITDIHPDPYYKIYSSTERGVACHRGSGPAGTYGAETSDCDSPLALVNATFQWLEEHIKGTVDFVVWTGDSARHDNDEHIPRNQKQVIGQNQLLVDKMKEVFGVAGPDDEPRSPRAQPLMKTPVVPTFGNNDILPHNIFEDGPNPWTISYNELWRDFIPEEQRHGFARGGWFYVEVIPNRLAVFSLNTMYFSESNAAVDGCGDVEEPGFEHMEWLRIQLQFLRERGMKAIISGHVPPGRNEAKALWDETCWQKYALWLRQYRDVVVGSMYGHMNIEHFVLQDFDDIDFKIAAQGYDVPDGLFEAAEKKGYTPSRSADGDVNVKVNAPNYLNAQRELWAKLPSELELPGDESSAPDDSSKKKKHDKAVGGEWAERFSLSLVTASVVPNYFSTIRVYEYNITGLDESVYLKDAESSPPPRRLPTMPGSREPQDDNDDIDDSKAFSMLTNDAIASDQQQQQRPLRSALQTKKKKKPKFTIPDPPSSTTTPGPAYSPQTLSLTGYTQYIANNTWLNHDLSAAGARGRSGAVGARGWREGKHVDRRPGANGTAPAPRAFAFEVEYATGAAGDEYGFKTAEGLAMRQWVRLASRIGEFEPGMEEEDDDEGGAESSAAAASSAAAGCREEDGEGEGVGRGGVEADKHKKKKKKKKKKEKKRRKEVVRAWFAFVSRALTGTLDDAELRERFGSEGAHARAAA